MGSSRNITLYTNHGCPWAQRVHIALKELGIEPTEEVIIDLQKPREQWYLDQVNAVSPALRLANFRSQSPEIITCASISFHSSY